jgi:hypothetical protein
MNGLQLNRLVREAAVIVIFLAAVGGLGYLIFASLEVKAAEFDPTPGVGMTAWGQALPPRCNAYFDTADITRVVVRPGVCVVPWLANLAEFWRWGADQPAPHLN